MTSAKPSAADSWPKAINRRIARFWAATLYRKRLPFGLPDPMLRAITRASLEGTEVGAHHLTRFAMYKALGGALAAHDGPGRRCLAISSSSRLVRLLGLKSVRIAAANYPEHSLLALKFRDATFDFCVSDQVLEHVAGDPFQAVTREFSRGQAGRVRGAHDLFHEPGARLSDGFLALFAGRAGVALPERRRRRCCGRRLGKPQGDAARHERPTGHPRAAR